MANGGNTIEENKYLTSVLEKVRTKLLDTSRRNRLLNFKETARDVPVIDEMPNQVFEHLVLNGGSFKFNHFEEPEVSEEEYSDIFIEGGSDKQDRTLPNSQPPTKDLPPRYKDDCLQTPIPKRDLERKLRRLFSDHRLIIQETGANNLHLSIGFLEWVGKQENDVRSRSPLILVPVSLTKSTNVGETLYKLQFDGQAIDTNYSLYEKLKNNFEINLPLIEEEQLPEDYWKKVTQAISSWNDEGWNVVREITLGLFRFSKQVMWHDLNPKRWPTHSPLVDKKVLKRILVGPRDGDTRPCQYTEEYNQDDDGQNEKLNKLPIILDADSSQYSALIDSLRLKDGLVIEGPPGTGKSQTISNLIAIALEKGLSILFVAEKMAALDVVYNRLEETGLGDFCLQLHGLKTNKKQLLSSLKNRIDLKVNSPSDLPLLDSDINLTKKELIEFSKVMSERVGPEKMPLYDVTWNIENLKQNLPDNYQKIKIDNLDTMTFELFRNTNNLLDDLGTEWESIPLDARKSWYGFIPETYNESLSDKVVILLGNGISASKVMNDWLNSNKVNNFSPTLYQIARLLKFGNLNANKTLPDIPSGIHLPFIYNIIHGDLTEDYSSILSKLKEYLDIVKDVNKIFDYASTNADQYAKLLATYSELLSGVCCIPEVLLTNIPKEHSLIEKVISTLNCLPEISAPIIELSEQILRTIDDYKTLIKIVEGLSSGPIELSLHAHEFHLKSAVNNYFSLAKAKSNELINDAKNLSLFNISNDIETELVKESYQAIYEQRESWFPILNKEYRKGKKYIRRVMIKPKEFTRKNYFPTEIKRLLKYCIDRDEFKSNSDYKLALGTLFNGADTNWGLLNKVIKYSQKLRDDVGIENAINIISDWDTHIENMRLTKDRLNASFCVLSKYADSHPFPKILWQRPISEISRTLLPWKEKLSDATNDLIQPWCNTNVTLTEALSVTKSYKHAKSKENALENHIQFDVLLKEYWDKSLTNLDLLQKQNKWFQDRLAVDCINIELLKLIVPDSNSFRKELFVDMIKQSKILCSPINIQINNLNKIGSVEVTKWLGGETSTLTEFINKLGGAVTTIKYLSIMMRWRGLDKQVNAIGLHKISNALTTGEINGASSSVAFKYSFYSGLLDEKISSNSLLSTFTESKYENLREKFAKHDKEILKLNSQQIASQLCTSNIPEGNGSGRISTYTEKRLIMHEERKKTRHIPIRQLVRRSSNAMQALKPCFLMSPLSVSQYLAPGDIEFDLVIMDEASQIRPEYALSSIARANRCIIVGDPKQLPPTTFFDTVAAEVDSEEETIVDDTESILDVCLKQFPFRRLRWHYRSQHESLIQFSNDRFYDNDLIIFPSPKGDSKDFGVHYTYIDNPSYKTGRNKTEAELVVENIIHYFHRHKKRSLGVATFNKRQAEEIQLLLEKRIQTDPAINELMAEHGDTEPLFIKNLENVQGDERDVIFISTTYGPEKAGGQVLQRFGPINSDLGWRRLNVIATRSRQRVEVFSSLKPTDIRIGEGSKRGVRSLRDYLEYASTGKIKDHGEGTGKKPDSDFEIAVIKIINKIGYGCEPQVGVAGFFIDIGVMHPDRPGEYLLGIECDGATYHSARSVRDRDRLRQEILEDKGWEIHRIWSTSWFQSRSAEIDKLERVLKSKLEKDRIITDKISDLADEKEILESAQHATAEEIIEEEKILTDSLEVALNRYWTKNISPYFSDRSKSILSEQMIHYLVKSRPQNEEDWFNFIPMNLRQNMDPDEKEYLPDIIDVVVEYV